MGEQWVTVGDPWLAVGILVESCLTSTLLWVNGKLSDMSGLGKNFVEGEETAND